MSSRPDSAKFHSSLLDIEGIQGNEVRDTYLTGPSPHFLQKLVEGMSEGVF